MSDRKAGARDSTANDDEVLRCIASLKRESQGRATEEAAAYQLALLLDVRTLLERLAKDFEASLVA